MRCCRYMKFEHAEQSLKDCYFKTARPISFNDPFECRGRLVNLNEVLRKYVQDNFERLRCETILHGENQDVVTEEYVYNGLSKVAGKSDRSWLSSIDKTVLMICFVKEEKLKQNSDVLFWSHYADAGRGVRITFNFEERPRGGLYYMKEVEYADEVPVFDCGLMKEWMQGPEFRSYIEKLSCTKGRAWEYENEIRMIIPRYLRLRSNPKFQEYLKMRYICGCGEYFVNIGYDAICRVDFGLRVDKSKRESVIRFLRQNPESAHITFYETVFDPIKYVYQYNKIA